MAAIVNWLPLLLRRRKREKKLASAAEWPRVTASLLKSTVISKDPLAEGRTAFQVMQVEAAFYFTLHGEYYGGHLRTVPMSDSEAHRMLRNLPEETPVQVRYNPANPDETVVLDEDNAGFPCGIWPN